jgi:hypothetical protein
MATTDPSKLLAGIDAKISKRAILVTVLGLKMPLRVADGTTRLVSMETDTPSSITYAIGPGFAPPTEQDQWAILEFWRKEPLAPDAYKYTEGTRPPLTIEPKTITK